MLLLHVLIGLAIALLLFPWQSQQRRNPTIRIWSRVLLSICGARLRVSGVALDAQLARSGVADWTPGRLLLSNHISWIDVFAILATLPSRFVAKAEIGRWPLLGWLVTLVGTLYIERGRRHAVAAMNHQVHARLKAGETIAVFPEGTTTDGSELLPFHSNLIAPALEVGCDVWPVALRYTERGQPSRAAAFVGQMGLVTSLWNILVARRLAIEVTFLESIGTTADRNRHHIAHAAQEAIAASLGVPAPAAHARLGASPRSGTSTPVTPGADTADTAPGSASDQASASR
jgi:1-acyl-sn-glycerol-3-phosphate acyltransferase